MPFDCSGSCSLLFYYFCGFREDFFMFSYYKPLVDTDARGVAFSDPRDMVGSINKGDSLTLLQTRYNSSMPHGFR